MYFSDVSKSVKTTYYQTLYKSIHIPLRLINNCFNFFVLNRLCFMAFALAEFSLFYMLFSFYTNISYVISYAAFVGRYVLITSRIYVILNLSIYSLWLIVHRLITILNNLIVNINYILFYNILQFQIIMFKILSSFYV